MTSITLWPFGWRLRNQRDGRENRSRDDGLGVNNARLTTNLLQLVRVGDGLWPLVHVAQTARRQSHSCLVPRLEEAERANVEKEDQRESPDEGRVDKDQ